MKKKLIAMLCAIAMLSNIAAFAEPSETPSEPETVQTDVIDTVDDRAEEDDAADEDVADVTDATEDEQEEIPADEPVDASEDEAADETLADESGVDSADEPEGEDPAAGGSMGMAPLTLRSASAPISEDAADKTALTALIAEAGAITADMVDAAMLADLADAIADAQAVADAADADQADVDAAVEELDAVVAEAVQAIRDNLYEILNACKGLDKGILGADTYNAYENAYKAASIAYWDAEKTGAELYSLGAAVETTFAAAAANVTAEEKILSGNVITTADRAFYEGYESDTLPELKYKWADDANPEPAGQDKYGTVGRLLSGVGATPYDNAPNICWGKWSWHGTTNIDFELGEAAYISGADFWENAGASAGTNYCSDKIAVYTSDNGQDWTLQKEVTVDQSDCPNSLKGTRVDFDAPVKCRHVRVAVIDNLGYQVKYNEIVLRGYRSSQVKAEPVTFEEIDYKSVGSGAKRLISIDGENRVRVTGTIKNNAEESTEAYVITAAYKDGSLIDMIFVKKTVDSFGTETFTNTVTLGGETDVKLHTFVWNNFTEAKALSAIKTFGLDEHEMASVIAEGEGAKFDIGSERLTVWGATGTKSTLNDVTVMVLKAGITAADMEELSNANKKRAILYLEQTAPDSDGKYAFEYFPQDTSSMYGNNNVYVKEQGVDQIFYRALFLDGAGEDAVLAAFGGAADAEAMRAVINEYDYLINGVAAIEEIVAKYDTDDTPDTVETSPVFDSVAGMILDVTFEDANDVVAEIFAAAALTDVNSVETSEEVIASIDKYCEELGISDNGIYTDLYSAAKNASFKSEVSEKFVGQDYANIADFIAEFCETVVVDLMNDITNYSDVMPILEADREYLEKLGFDLEEYDDLKPSEKVRVQKAIAKKGSFADIAAIKEAFNDAVENPGTDKSYGGSYSSGGGGSTGSASLGTSIPMSGVTAQDVSVFKDLTGVEWARESILALHKKGIVSGMTSNMFAPNDDVTREQFTKMLISAFELYDADAECDFDDADADAWYYRYIASAVNEGIVYGVSEDNFGVGAKITREDMAVLAYRALVAKGNKVVYDESQISDFTDDAEISEYARDAVYAMRGNSVMLGRGNNEFQPKACATRAEAAKIIYSIMAK